jgi:hypothetical protein
MKVRMPNATCIVVGITVGMLVACGTVGSPIPPEMVGVTPIIEQQKKLEAEKQRDAAAAESAEAQPDTMLQGQDVNLPPLQPVGTR